MYHLPQTASANSRYCYSSGNVFTTSSPATSANFDKDLLKLPGHSLQLIRHVELQIDWADELWAKFPLIARVLGSIQALKSLKITIITKPSDHVTDDWSAMALKVKGARNGCLRQGAMAQVMLKAEKKVLMSLVLGLQALHVFKLQGFADDKFARDLERFVSNGRRLLSVYYNWWK